jgi:hypothetical protein
VAENFMLYSQTYDALPEEQMRRLAGEADFGIEEEPGGGRCFRYRWDRLTIHCHEMARQELPGHLQGFAGYVRHIYGGKPDERGERVLDRIAYTRLGVGVVVEPKLDKKGGAENLLGSLVYGLDALMFYGDALYDKDSRLILGPDGSFDETADVLGPVAQMIKDRVQVRLPEGEGSPATAGQQDRYRRVREELKQRKVPTLSYPLYIDDEEEVRLREPAEVARRVLVLYAVTYLADGGPRETALNMIERGGLWPAVSPEEEKFLRAEKADPDAARKLLWRLEALCPLVWSLGGLGLPWPSGFCDVPRLTGVVRGYAADPGFVAGARLRRKTEVLDALQLTLLQHWAIRDAFIHNRPVPVDLDWSHEGEMEDMRACPATGVVAERHHAFNWLTRFGDADWDRVDTPT